MRTHVTINERIKDLRVEKKLTQENLSNAIGIPKSTLAEYEKDDYPVPHTVVIKMAEYFCVTADYLLGLSDNRVPHGRLPLSDNAVKALKSDRINKRLLSEMISSEGFTSLMVDAEVFVDGHVDGMLAHFNSLMKFARKKLCKSFPNADDAPARALKMTAMMQEDYFAQILSKDMIGILNEVRSHHMKDSDTADHVYSDDVMEEIINAAKVQKGDKLKKNLCSCAFFT